MNVACQSLHQVYSVDSVPARSTPFPDEVCQRRVSNVVMEKSSPNCWHRPIRRRASPLFPVAFARASYCQHSKVLRTLIFSCVLHDSLSCRYRQLCSSSVTGIRGLASQFRSPRVSSSPSVCSLHSPRYFLFPLFWTLKCSFSDQSV